MIKKGVIWKYNISIEAGRQEIQLPKGAEILSIQNQYGGIAMWVLVEENTKKEEDKIRYFEVYGTGHPIPLETGREYIATVLISPFVWHIFEHK